jgi:hypothetical protein
VLHALSASPMNKSRANSEDAVRSSYPARADGSPLDSGSMEYWTVEKLPAPPPFGFHTMMKLIGPGEIMAATSIGGGEWLVGPAAAVKYSSSIFF